MPRIDTTLTIFVSSPSDVSEERDVVDKVVNEINGNWSSDLNVRFDVIRWERDAVPGFGLDAQDVINREVGYEYDIFVGIMWARFGTPTIRAGSGTEEEFEIAFERYTFDPSSVQIMFYFKTPPAPGKFDPSQLIKVSEFKSKLSNRGGLWASFDTAQEFENLLRSHLSKVIASRSKNILRSIAPSIENPSPDSILSPTDDATADIQSALAGLTKDSSILETAEDHFMKGNAQLALGYLDEAVQSFTQSLELKQHGATYGNRAVAFVRQGDSLSAMSDYNRAIELASKDARWYSNRGNLYSDIGDYTAALRDVNQAIRLDPKLPEARNNLGRIYIQLKEFDREIEEFDELIDMNPQNARAFANRGAAYGDKLEFDRAIEDYTEAIRLDPSQAQSFTNRGHGYRQQKKLDLALADFDRAVHLEPEGSTHYSNRSSAHIEMDELELASSDCKKSLELNPDNPDASYNLACIFSKQGDVDKALEHLTKAVSLNPLAVEQARVDDDLERFREDPRAGELLGE